MKGRREFLTFVGATAAWPFAAQAQQGVPLVAFLSGRSHAESGPVLEEFKKGLAENGFADGRNLRFEYRWAEGHYSQLPNLAAELVELRPRVIVTTGGNVTALAAKAATASIPIIFAAGGDPIKSGLVDSLSRPGGNATGVSLYIAELAPKRLQFLLEIVHGRNELA